MSDNGLSEEEARYAAQRAFGGVERHKDAVRDERGTSWVEDVAAGRALRASHVAPPTRLHHRRVAHARA